MKTKLFTLLLATMASIAMNAQFSSYQLCGDNLSWFFEESTGQLRIGGSGDMYDYDHLNNHPAPWYNLRDKITSILFEEEMIEINSDIPILSNPDEGHVTIVINIPELSECNGIALKGSLDGIYWTSADQYLGEYGPTDAYDCIKFEKIEGNWYKATYRFGIEPYNETPYLVGKICLIYSNDINWEGQALEWEVDNKNTTAIYSITSDNFLAIQSSGLVYVKIGDWNRSECCIPQDFHVTVKVPTCAEVTPEIIGDFDGWTGTPLTKNGDVWETNIRACRATDYITVREAGGTWDNCIQYYNVDEDGFYCVPSEILRAKKNVIIDYSDPALYRWAVCADADYIVKKSNVAPKSPAANVKNNGITYIGAYAFYGCSGLTSLEIPSNVASIGDYAFAECKNFDAITCYATTVPAISDKTFENIGNKQYIYLYVPADRERAYKRDMYWGEFDVQVIGGTKTTTDELIVESIDDAADIIWPTISGAETYELVIKDKEGNVVCTLIFNSEGQLLSIVFGAPARGTSSEQTQTEGFSFSVTGLEEGETYDLTITAKDADGNVIDVKSITFLAGAGKQQGISQMISLTGTSSKILRDGQILILRGDKTYTMTGQEVK